MTTKNKAAQDLARLSHDAQRKMYGGKKGYSKEMSNRSKKRKKLSTGKGLQLTQDKI